MIGLAQVISWLESIAPLELAADWDNVGLLLGDKQTSVDRIMTCLTVTPESAAEAIAEKAQLIVSHHPILFRGVKRLTTATAEGRVLWQLANAGIAVYSPHTAYDNAPEGINDQLAARLGLTNPRPLRVGEGSRQCKIVVFVPEGDLGKVSDAMFSAGAGNIGQYSQCSFRLAGTGTFFGSGATKPTIGEKGRREEVSEWRLEAVCPERLVDQVTAALGKAHSYEEPAYDVYPLRPGKNQGGHGRIGELSHALPLAGLARFVKERLPAPGLQMVGDPTRPARKIALACGAAGEFLADAAAAGADVFLTGEIRFHETLAAQAEGVALLSAGHYATERLGVEALAERLRHQFPSLQVWPSRRERDPFTVP